MESIDATVPATGRSRTGSLSEANFKLDFPNSASFSSGTHSALSISNLGFVSFTA